MQLYTSPPQLPAAPPGDNLINQEQTQAQDFHKAATPQRASKEAVGPMAEILQESLLTPDSHLGWSWAAVPHLA